VIINDNHAHQISTTYSRRATPRIYQTQIIADMDDPNTSLTSNFGHSSQELMNLLLTGQAVSNVFDNSMKLSDDLTCRGIQSRSAIGYLSILESLRYCEVGGYYKSPTFPIWIVGSTSHFSVLFGDEVRHTTPWWGRGGVSSCIALITHYCLLPVDSYAAMPSRE
jgi:hypothetical protein